MAKKQFGKLAVLAALAGTAVGITYFLRYKSCLLYTSPSPRDCS